MKNVRVLTVADLHQSSVLYRELALSVEEHRPDVVAIVGDALEAFSASSKFRLTVEECAESLARLPVARIVFVRGNHEDSNWSEFVCAWPHQRRPLIVFTLPQLA